VDCAKPDRRRAHALTLSHTHTNTHTHTLSLSRTHIYTHTNTHAHTHTDTTERAIADIATRWNFLCYLSQKRFHFGFETFLSRLLSRRARFSLAWISEGYVTDFAPHKALNLIARGKLTLDGRVVLHCVKSGAGVARDEGQRCHFRAKRGQTP
jgi:hypothetical protein